ncbi:MAG: isopentenyl-diphosphate Delta-isomerase [Thermosediminibacterales bacterium]|nr:isopentenyl-diphosphate Delta-isomerase [Thermosediminibacterales bacterium]
MKSNKKREKRKLEHIKKAYLQHEEKDEIFNEFHLINNSLPELDFSKIDITTNLIGFKLSSPVFINAITGGSKEVLEINKSLARVAKRCNLAMAVGSQTAALKNDSVAYTFEIVREINPSGIIFANVNANATPEEAEEAVKMIKADALQIHLNVPQELMMTEGDRNFEGWRDNIKNIIEEVEVPVIVKEVGFGINSKVALILENIGVKAIDVGGRGGTNFIEIEKARQNDKQQYHCCKTFSQWGIPTPISLIETLNSVKKVDVIASGGINNGLSVAKSLCLGAKACGIAGCFLKTLLYQGEEGLIELINKIHLELKTTMLMTGASNVTQLTKIPIIVSGFSLEWLQQRGINVDKYAKRGDKNYQF